MSYSNKRQEEPKYAWRLLDETFRFSKCKLASFQTWGNKNLLILLWKKKNIRVCMKHLFFYFHKKEETLKKNFFFFFLLFNEFCRIFICYNLERALLPQSIFYSANWKFHFPPRGELIGKQNLDAISLTESFDNFCVERKRKFFFWKFKSANKNFFPVLFRQIASITLTNSYARSHFLPTFA